MIADPWPHLDRRSLRRWRARQKEQQAAWERAPWPPARWRATLASLHDLGARLDRLIAALRDVAGRPGRSLDDLMDAANALHGVLYCLEHPFFDALMEAGEDTLGSDRDVHGPGMTLWLGRRGRHRPGTRPLDRDEWADLGRRVR